MVQPWNLCSSIPGHPVTNNFTNVWLTFTVWLTYSLSGFVFAVCSRNFVKLLSFLELGHGFHHFGVFLAENMANLHGRAASSARFLPSTFTFCSAAAYNTDSATAGRVKESSTNTEFCSDLPLAPPLLAAPLLPPPPFFGILMLNHTCQGRNTYLSKPLTLFNFEPPLVRNWQALTFPVRPLPFVFMLRVHATQD